MFQIDCPPGCFYPPTLITGVNTASKVVMEEIFGPVLVAMPFRCVLRENMGFKEITYTKIIRTAKEAIAVANNTMYGLGASVHSEQLPLALETAKHIQAGAVWINCHNMFDAAAGFGGFKQSGYGRDGGKEGLYEYVKPVWQRRVRIANLEVDMKKFGSSYTADGPGINGGNGVIPDTGEQVSNYIAVLFRIIKEPSQVDRTYKLYYGGAQKRPDANYSRVIRYC